MRKWVTAGLLGSAALGGCGGARSPAVLAEFPFHGRRPISVLAHYFEYNGSAPAGDRVASIARDGLHIGVRRHAPGVFEGFFAVTRAQFPADSVFRVHMYREPHEVLSATQTGETVFAVQTGNTKQTGDINYVLVASVSTAGETHWEVGYATGHLANARTTILWAQSPTKGADTSEDITLRTDGHSTLEVSFGARSVYRSHALHMNIAAPFQAYLEVQALEIPYEARFRDFSVTAPR